MFYFPPGWWFQPIWTKILWNHPATQPPSLRNPSNRRSWTWWTWWRLGWRSFTGGKYIPHTIHGTGIFTYYIHQLEINQMYVGTYIYQSHGCGMGFATFSEVDRVGVPAFSETTFEHLQHRTFFMFFFMFCLTLKRRSDIYPLLSR